MTFLFWFATMSNAFWKINSSSKCSMREFCSFSHHIVKYDVADFFFEIEFKWLLTIKFIWKIILIHDKAPKNINDINASILHTNRLFILASGVQTKTHINSLLLPTANLLFIIEGLLGFTTFTLKTLNFRLCNYFK